ncbi:DUF1294 domain-containing protein [Pseudomonas sp. Fl5BN2]|uniref:DUF1294 domain-containing protein n=1 Tax=unclassified Pseudomonas TaxID=196821 RepID=UPI0013781950|nr:MULTISPECIES: DUF1294 domain-containing protein [unclassified Pseudomonas]NBF02036.1 DUF1294 domain-containing protein [Pseudomonas sp. Fl5BN2]NBF08025.1 DUF1294 domain-containing protein [Pseudomonas sp. Fl4BN1]
MTASRGDSRSGNGVRIQHPRAKLLAFVLLCGLPLFGSLSLWWRGISLIPLAAYGVVSLLTFLVYWHDKRRARVEGQRVPENVLHALELAGGWPGALLAQQLLRHKTRKVSYQALFWLIVALHQVYWIDRLFLENSLLTLL